MAWSPKAIGNVLMSVFGTVVILLIIAYVGGASQRELARRVDMRVGTIEVQLARHRYVTDCLFYTGPFIDPESVQPPEARDLAALKLCLAEATKIGPDEVNDIGAILEKNLRARGVE